MATDTALLEEMATRLRVIERKLDRLAQPVERLSAAEVCRVMGLSPKRLQRKTARGVFSDARSPDERKPRFKRMYFADEVQIHVLEGEHGVKRYRAEVGRR